MQCSLSLCGSYSGKGHFVESLVSIIVPVFNVEKYVTACLESIAAQTFPYFECILIDDGSTDRSGPICDDFCSRDSRFQVVHQANAGLGPARNTGLCRAKGDYIMFVDSDDSILPDMLKTLYQLLVNESYDWSMVGFYRVNEKGEALPSLNRVVFDGFSKIVLSGKEALERLWMDDYEGPTTFSVVWNKLYRTNIIRNVRFENFYSREDLPFNHKIYHKTTRGVYLRKPLYRWLYRADSLSNSESSPKKLYYSISAVASTVNDFNGEYAHVRAHYLEYYYSQLLANRRLIKGSPYYSSFLKQSHTLILQTLGEYLFKKGIPLKEKIAFLVFWPFPNLVSRWYRKNEIIAEE